MEEASLHPADDAAFTVPGMREKAMAGYHVYYPPEVREVRKLIVTTFFIRRDYWTGQQEQTSLLQK
jgi:hypothetical protein